MKTGYSRYAFIGLILAGAAVLSAIGFYVYRGTFTSEVAVSLGLIVVGLALFILLDPDRVRAWLGGRQARYGSNALILTLAFFGILGVVNYLAFENTKRWDLTEDQQFTLAPETIETLNKLPEPVKARAFFTGAMSSDTAHDLLDRMALSSNGRFTYEFIDPNQDPLAAQQDGITQDGSIVLSMGEQKQLVRFSSEEELATGLVRLMSPETYTIYFLGGHGERNPDDGGMESLSQLKSTLEGKNYTVKTLNLLTASQVPEDAKAVVIAGPTKPFDNDEIDALKAFVSAGGSLIVMSEPGLITNISSADDPLAAYLLATWGIELADDIVIDMSTQQVLTAVSAGYGSHAITTPIRNTYTLFPTTRSVRTAADAQTGSSVVELIFTGAVPQSWAETDWKALTSDQPQMPQFDETQDQPGPVSIAAATEDPGTGARVVVFGDADFAINANFNQYANSDLIVNAIDWVVGQESMISLTPKEQTSRVMLPPGRVAIYLLYSLSVCALPLLALVSGTVVFLQRRRKG